jgi:prolyl-tRNA synthetase
MRWSQAHIPTLREAPQEAEVVSHQLMLRAGMLRRLASGIYSFLPMGWKSLLKLQQIIREEMNRSGAQEVSLPVVQPKELWEESGRWALYAKEMARLKDRHDNDFCLQPTSEEAITDLVRRDVRSYRQLPLNFYQIQTKFRDEIRPRFGLMRGREFIMKDAYSFDLTADGAAKNYEIMRSAYRRIFTRTGLRFKAVVADTGAIGGSKSEEFHVLASSGEDEIVSCTSCGYGANQEKAQGVSPLPGSSPAGAVEKFSTPGLRTIEELAGSLKCKPSDLMKTMVATDSEGSVILVLLRGDHALHELKLQALLKEHKGVRLAREDEIKVWNLPKGSLGPYQFPMVGGKPAVVVMDSALSDKCGYVCGANEEGFHLRNVVLSRDVQIKATGVIRHVLAGEGCVDCGKPLEIVRGIEVGHVFYLGQKYSKAMNLTVTTEDGQASFVEMGCYGIGVGRTLAACIEQNHDKDGIIWPVSLAPFEVAIASLGEGRPQQEAEKLYRVFLEQGIDVIWDDRDQSPGVKLKDLDLVGIPFQIIVGEKGLKNEQVEFKIRGRSKDFIPLASAAQTLIQKLQEERQNLRAAANQFV